MREEKDILRQVRKEAENIMIPKSITPEKVRQKLERIESDKVKARYFRKFYVVTTSLIDLRS